MSKLKLQFLFPLCLILWLGLAYVEAKHEASRIGIFNQLMGQLLGGNQSKFGENESNLRISTKSVSNLSNILSDYAKQNVIADESAPICKDGIGKIDFRGIVLKLATGIPAGHKIEKILDTYYMNKGTSFLYNHYSGTCLLTGGGGQTDDKEKKKEI